MKIVEKPLELRKITDEYRKNSKTIGFVPTMGALHEGHLSLIRKSKEDNDITICSIFVNPKQFGPNEDFNKYPRTYNEDCKLLINEGVDLLFIPSVEDMYPENYQTYVELTDLPEHLCGLSRPGHFKGVATVVTKLFNIVRPDRAYFGKKDYQQLQIIKRMNIDLNFYIEIVEMPIIREENGLAMSSRNKYLTNEERAMASNIYKSLLMAKEAIDSGILKPATIINKIKKYLLENIPDCRIDYIKIVDKHTLEDLKDIDLTKGGLIAIAIFIGNTRLIDNIEF